MCHAAVFFSTYNRPSTSTRWWDVARTSMMQTQNYNFWLYGYTGVTEFFGTHFIIKPRRRVTAETATRKMIAAAVMGKYRVGPADSATLGLDEVRFGSFIQRPALYVIPKMYED